MPWVDITTAIGTAGAAVVALALGLKAEWRATRAEHRARVQDERRQAVHVAAWMLVDPENPSLDPGPVYAYLVVQNASDEPIWDVIAYTPKLTEKDRGNPWLDLSETRNEIGFMAPHETHKSMIGARTLHGNRYPLWVEFRDNAGRSWSRDLGGRLHQRKDSSPRSGFGGILFVRKADKLDGEKPKLWRNTTACSISFAPATRLRGRPRPEGRHLVPHPCRSSGKSPAGPATVRGVCGRGGGCWSSSHFYPRSCG